MSMQKYGDWARAGAFLANWAPNSVDECQKELRDQAEKFKKIVLGHIERQDLPWVAFSPNTIRSKKANKTIHYVETHEFRNSMEVRKIKSSAKDVVIFAGFSPWATHTSGGYSIKMSSIMEMNEYGFVGLSKSGKRYGIPPRPLLRPSYDEAEKNFKADMYRLGNRLVRGD